MNIAVCVVCAVLMILGAAELVRLLVFWWTKPLDAGKFVLVTAPDSAEECEAVLRSAAERIRWLELKGPCRLICVNRRGDGEIDKICRLLALRYPYLRVCKTEDLVYHILENFSSLEEQRERERTE